MTNKIEYPKPSNIIEAIDQQLERMGYGSYEDVSVAPEEAHKPVAVFLSREGREQIYDVLDVVGRERLSERLVTTECGGLHDIQFMARAYRGLPLIHLEGQGNFFILTNEFNGINIKKEIKA